jgi:hypothetical protein
MRSKVAFLRWFPQILLVLMLVVALAVGGCSLIPKSTSTPEGVGVPINLNGASNVGSLHIELVYDSTVLEATGVKAGKLGRNAVIECNLETPGRAIIGIVDASGINGDGSVVTVSFKAKGKEGTSPLTLESVEANDAETLYDLITKTSPGEFMAKGSSFTAPGITFAT